METFDVALALALALTLAAALALAVSLACFCVILMFWCARGDTRGSSLRGTAYS